eukprot:c13867_g1_i1.p1 GENE.c13867_g1_i1~~c13867_g1_i1.p1  ORF type:complete len:299 (-),score=76.99 c13867_g1_i1:115-981(-)
MSNGKVIPPPIAVPNFSLENPGCYIVTGGSQGLGFEICVQLKRAGAKGIAIVSDQNETGQQACKKVNQIPSNPSCLVVFVFADLSNAEQVVTVVDSCVELLKSRGPIVGLVNCAGDTSRGSLHETDMGLWDKMLNVNLRAPFVLTQAISRHMMNNNVRGSIVNISSSSAHGGGTFMLAYSVSKAALSVMTRNNASELMNKGIRVNAVNMGWCLTDNEHKLQSSTRGERWLEQTETAMPIGRILRAVDVASVVGFLMSDSAPMMTGAVIDLAPESIPGLLPPGIGQPKL